MGFGGMKDVDIRLAGWALADDGGVQIPSGVPRECEHDKSADSDKYLANLAATVYGFVVYALMFERSPIVR